MCVKSLFSAPKLPKMPTAGEPATKAPVQSEAVTQGQMDDAAKTERRKAAAKVADNSTLLTSPLGLQTEATTTKKTLLGA
jgi:hypothetical protein